MSIETILKNVAPEPVAPRPDVVGADLARGRAALAVAHRRRTYRRVGAAGALAAAAAAAVVVLGSGGLNSPARASGSGLSASNAHGGKMQIKLVDYSGAQLPGFTVSEVPQGWQLSTSTPYALLITPNGSADNNPDVFVGKLAVLTSSVDQHGLGSGDPVTVNGQPGRVREQDGELLLNYNSANGFGVNIQAPDSLGWGDAQIVAFADGITVTAHAVHSVG